MPHYSDSREPIDRQFFRMVPPSLRGSAKLTTSQVALLDALAKDDEVDEYEVFPLFLTLPPIVKLGWEHLQL